MFFFLLFSLLSKQVIYGYPGIMSQITFDRTLAQALQSSRLFVTSLKFVSSILVPRCRDPFGQHQESWTSGRSPESSTIRGLIVKSYKSDWLKIIEWIFCACSKIGTGQRSRFFVLTKRIAASRDENVLPRLCVIQHNEESSNMREIKPKLHL